MPKSLELGHPEMTTRGKLSEYALTVCACVCMRECQKERERERGRERDPLPSNGVYRAEATHGECHNKDSDAVRPGVAIRCITCVQLIAAVDHPQVGNLQELVEENEVVVPGRTESAKRRGAGVRSRGNEREDRQEASERRGGSHPGTQKKSSTPNSTKRRPRYAPMLLGRFSLAILLALQRSSVRALQRERGRETH